MSRIPLLVVAVLLVCAFALPAQAAAAPANSADRMIVWTGCPDLPKLSDADLETWKRRGVDGFVCMTRQLRGLGGIDAFDPRPGAPLAGEEFKLQRTLRDSRVVERMRARGMKAYLGVYLTNYWNPRTPLADWFDDSAWGEVVLPRMAQLAGVARGLGFEGIAFDQELYPTDGGRESATWNWNYPGNRRGEQATRAQAERRGGQLMRTLLDAFPGLELMAYDVQLPHSWSELVQRQANGRVSAFGDRLDVDFLDGLAGAEGYESIRLVDATFYKMPHYGTWNSSLDYNYNSLYAHLSRRLSNWDKLAGRLDISPFAWIDEGPCACDYDDVRSPAFVRDQLAAFRRWGMGREFTVYAHNGLDGFDYAPYAEAMRAASRPAVVDTERPRLTMPRAPKVRAARLSLSGEVSDNMAVRVVRWRTDRGRSGVAKLDWRVRAGDPVEGYSATTRWSLRLTRRPGERRVVISAEDIKGLVTRRSIRLGGRG